MIKQGLGRNEIFERTGNMVAVDGVFTDDDGTDFLPGQTVSYPAGLRRSTFSTEGCTVLVVAHTGSTVVTR